MVILGAMSFSFFAVLLGVYALVSGNYFGRPTPVDTSYILIELLINGLIFLSLGGLFILFRRRGFEPAVKFIVMFGLFVIVADVIFVGNGLYDLTLPFVFVILIAAAAFAGKRTLYQLTALIVGSIVLIFLLQVYGWVDIPFPQPALIQVLFFAAAVLLATLLLHISMVRLVERTTQLNQQADSLRRVNDELDEYKEHLEDIVAQRTEDLLKAKQMADEANRAKSEFLANMSHELRTPLNTIIGYSEIIEEDAQAIDHTEIEGDAARIKRAGRHLLGLINDVLDLTKIEAQRLEIDMVPISIDTLVDELTILVDPMVRRKQNTLRIKTADEYPLFVSDPIRLRQILLNLLGNAAKFTSSGEITLAIKAEGNSLLFEVTDSGIGIHPDALANIFLPFNQEDNSKSRRFGGTGLGLTITKHLCEMMGGTISVESVLGRGSTFCVVLPLASSEIRPSVEQFGD